MHFVSLGTFRNRLEMKHSVQAIDGGCWGDEEPQHRERKAAIRDAAERNVENNPKKKKIMAHTQTSVLLTKWLESWCI